MKERLSAVVLAVLAHLLFAALAFVLNALVASLGGPATVAVVCLLAPLGCLGYASVLRFIVVRVPVKGISFHDFLWQLCALMFTAIAMFACLFFVLYAIDPQSLTAMTPTAPTAEIAFNCWYFSVLSFSFFGVSDILPTTLSTRFLLTLEAITSFLTLVFILSDFVALRESIREQAPTKPST